MNISVLINMVMPFIIGIFIFYLLAKIISCSAELSMKKVFITSEPGLGLTRLIRKRAYALFFFVFLFFCFFLFYVVYVKI